MTGLTGSNGLNGSAKVHNRLAEGEVLIADLSNIKLAGRSGVVWALDSPQMNANLVTIHAGDEISEHVNHEVDVLMVIESGSGEVVIDESATSVAAASVVLIPRGARRQISSTDGLVYYSIHQRRSGLSVG